MEKQLDIKDGINKITTIIGIIIILLAPISVFTLDKVTWWDSLAGILSGTILIYVKSPSFFIDIFKNYLNKGK